MVASTDPTPVAQSKPKVPTVAARRAPEPPKPATPAAEKPAQERSPVSLEVQQLKGAEFERVIHRAYPPKSHTIEDMRRPAYWATVAQKLRPWEQIEVCAEDGTWFAQLLVLAVERSAAVVHVLSYHELSTADVALTALAGSEKYEVKHTPGLGWHIIRKADRHIVRDHLNTRDDAVTTLAEYLKTIPA